MKRRRDLKTPKKQKFLYIYYIYIYIKILTIVSCVERGSNFLLPSFLSLQSRVSSRRESLSFLLFSSPFWLFTADFFFLLPSSFFFFFFKSFFFLKELKRRKKEKIHA